jgi:hypothetical protein
MPRPDDEHMRVPTWRLKQLQDIEHAARTAVELLDEQPPDAPLVATVRDLLSEALGE